MADERTLEELRSKIIASMGTDTEVVPPTKHSNPIPNDLNRKRARIERNPENHGERMGSARGSSFPNGPPRGRYDPNRNMQGEVNPYLPQNSNNYHNNWNRNSRQDYNDYGRENDNNGNSRYRTRYRNDNPRQNYNRNDYNKNMNTNTNKDWNNSSRFGDNIGYQNFNNNNGDRKRQQRIKNSFGNVPLYKNLTAARLNCILVVNKTTISDEDEEIRVKDGISKLCRSFGSNLSLSHFTVDKESKQIILELNSPECSCKILSSRSFIQTKYGLPSENWTRPNDYIGQIDNPNPYINGNTIVLENIEINDIEGSSNEDKVYNLMQKNNVKLEINQFELLSYNKEGEDSIFIGSILIKSLVNLDSIKTQLISSKINWFKPNESAYLKQETSSMIFSNIRNKVKEDKIKESKVLLLLNCVNPLELKDLEFAQKIEECLMNSFEDIESVQIVKPSADYRLTFDFVKEQAGNIYAKFQDIESAKKAIAKLSQQKFNDRSVICTYIDEEDYKLFIKTK